MRHTTRTYFIERVLKSYETFVNYYNNREFGLRTDTFNAGNVAESLLDLPEHVFTEFNTSTGFQNARLFRKSISDNNSHYKIVCDLANVIKHKEIDRNNPTFTNLDSVKESIATVLYIDLLGKYFRTRKLLEVTLLDGRVYEIGDILFTSIKLWSNILTNLGVIPSNPKLPDLLPKFAKRKDERFNDEILIRGFVGESFQHQLRALVYRKTSNTITEIKPSDKFGTSDIRISTKINHSPF